MFKKILSLITTGALLLTIALLTSCGGGAGTSSSSASLEIALDKTTTASGNDVVYAKVTLSSLTGAPVNGVKVRVESSDATVIPAAEMYTNLSGVANIPIKANWVSSDKSVSLRAASDGITPSTGLTVKVVAPKLTISIPADITGDWTNNFAFNGRVITSNYQLKLLDGNGNPVSNQVISLYVDSLTGKDASNPNNQIVYTPTQSSMIIAPPGVFTGTTDSSGVIIIPMYIQMDLAKPFPCTTDPLTLVETCSGKALSIMTANWRAVAQLAAGQTQTTITTYGSSLITFTNTGA